MQGKYTSNPIYFFKDNQYYDLAGKWLIWNGRTWKKIANQKTIKELNKKKAIREL